MPETSDPPLQLTPAYRELVLNQGDFKNRVEAVLKSRFPDLRRDVPRGPHNLDFAIRENFFGFYREWAVVIHSGSDLLGYERAVRIVGSYKEDIERHAIHGVLVVTQSGLEKFAESFLANNVGFIHRTLNELLALADQAEKAVALDHSSQTYKDVVEGLKATAESLRGENEGIVSPQTRDRLIHELQAGLELLKSSELRVELFVDVALKTLTFIVKQMGNSAVGIGATAAVLAISRMLGL